VLPGLATLTPLTISIVLASIHISHWGADKNSPKRHAGSIHCGMSELEIKNRIILTSEIFSTAIPIENSRFSDKWLRKGMLLFSLLAF
jgi:hypothetical protein